MFETLKKTLVGGRDQGTQTGSCTPVHYAVLKAQAEGGDADSMCNLALLYMRGWGCAKSLEFAEEWACRAASTGSDWAKGLCREYGYGVGKDADEAVKWYRKAIESQSAGAMYSLGSCYSSGVGVAKDRSEAIRYYRAAADRGNPYAMSDLALHYKLYGNSAEKSLAINLYKKAASLGHVGAMYGLYGCYEKGVGIARDEKAAFKWLVDAAEHGHSESMKCLGYKYVCCGNVDLVIAGIDLLVRAAEKGNTDGLWVLGNWLYHGDHLPQSYVDAVYWYRKAAEFGNSSSMYDLAVCYKDGKGVVADWEEARRWCLKAAEHGHIIAMTEYGHYCAVRDEVEIAKWYRKAAEKGYARAMYELGICYKQGRGVEVNIEEAAKWLVQAVEHGEFAAASELRKIKG